MSWDWQPLLTCVDERRLAWADLACPRICSRCGEEKPRDEFPQQRQDEGSRPRLHAWCRACHRVVAAENVKGGCMRRLRYGLDKDAFAALVAAQCGRCAICSKNIGVKPKDTHVDHCHATGRIRGILCAKCNHGIGAFRDDVSRMAAAIHYLRKSADA